MNGTAFETPISTTVSGLSDRHLLHQLKRLTAVEHQLEIVVIDHLRELERRRLYLSRGCSSLFDYATRELGYSEAAAWRRIKATAGKSTRQVEKLLAGVAPELTAPADRIRPLGAGRWELKAVIDDDCRQGLDSSRGLSRTSTRT